ncbi:MAG: polyisoprenoid-binding protein [Chitinophagaceae bacterium]|nr:MAG: polyisoprenoid-binding protein [Chitinophagaceae bacterium]
MKRIFFIITAFVALTAFTAIQGTWKNDPAHSQLGFTVTHLGINDVSGTFDDFDVIIKSSRPDFSDASVELSAKIASINTRVPARDSHLKSADFFDAEKYPVMSFKSTSLKKAGKNKFKLAGNLNLHGITRPVIMEMQYKGTVVNQMDKKPTAGFQITGIIDRAHFNIGNGFPPPMISNEVRIKADGEFVQ